MLLIARVDDILKGMNYKRIVKYSAIFVLTFLTLFSSCRKIISAEEWFGLYLSGQKIGFQHVALRRHDDGFLITDEEFIKVKMYDQEKRLRTISNIKVDGEFNLNAFEFQMKTQDQTMSVNGSYWNDTLYMKVKSGDITRERAIPVGDLKVITPSTFMGMLMSQRVKPGKYQMFDPSTFKIDTATVERIGKKVLEHRGKRLKCTLYRLSYLGTSNTFWVYDDGRIARIDMPMQIVAREEPAKEAQKVGSPMDLLSFYSIRVEKDIPNDAKEVVLRLTGIRPSFFDLDFAQQFLVESGDTWAEVRIVSEGRKTALEDTARYLASDPFIQADDPRIKSRVEQILSGMEDATDSAKVQRIMEWVFGYLQKKPSVTMPSAVDVLEQGYGDCNEHSVLFAALARAADIPTDVVVGLIYQRGAYYYHAWDAVYVNGEWVFVDPIFNEFPANVQHLMLKRGGIDKQSDIVSIIGNLKIKVLEVK